MVIVIKMTFFGGGAFCASIESSHFKTILLFIYLSSVVMQLHINVSVESIAVKQSAVYWKYFKFRLSSFDSLDLYNILFQCSLVFPRFSRHFLQLKTFHRLKSPFTNYYVYHILKAFDWLAFDDVTLRV